ncbi:MAG TPA: efflux RND transporter permease subunit [Elusimicrobiota bacterium]|nr:efflux RND transporter permease subunit [Elusimicrobiota bacterium]
MFKKLLSKLLEAPKMVAMAVALIFLAGFASNKGLQVGLFPSLNFPILSVVTQMPSYSSLEMERQITVPLESAFSGVLGVRKVRSASATGISMVSIQFAWGTDMLQARELILQALSSIRGQLPPNTEPSVETLGATLAMIQGYSLSGGPNTSPAELRDIAAYQLRPQLQRIMGVYKVLVIGGKALEYSVRLNPYLMIKYGVTLEDVRTALADNNILANPGTVVHDSQELVLHSDGQFSSAVEIGEVVIAVKDGIPVRVKDVARVTQTYQYERGDTSEDGHPAVLIQIFKQPSFGTLDVAARTDAEIKTFSKSLPEGVTIHNYYDQAQLVSDSIENVKENVWIGGLLVILVLAFALRSSKTTLIATISIPISVVAALILMRVLGIGLNVMSLGGLAIGTAIIVDDAIVVLENIFRWLSTPALRGKLGHKDLVIAATQEVIKPVVVSTMTNIGIFLPMVFVAGFAGRLFSPVSFTVTFTILASLIVAVTVIPTLALYWLTEKDAPPEETEGPLKHGYSKILKAAMRRPLAAIVLGLLPAVAALGFFRKLNVEFLPSLDEGAVLLSTLMPPGVSLTEAERVNRKIEKWAQSLPGVVTVARLTGHAAGAEDTDNINHSDIMIKLVPKTKRPIPLKEFIAMMNARTDALPSVSAEYLMPLADKINDAMGGVPADLGVNIFGPDLGKLNSYAQKLVKSMKPLPGIVNLMPPATIPVPSLQVTLNKKEAGRLGISEKTIYDTLDAYSVGLVATTIHQVLKRINVTLHYATPGQNIDFEAMDSLPLRTAGGNIVPLEQVANLSYSEIPSEIDHEHLSRMVTVTANISGRNARDVAADVRKAVEDLHLPPGYSWAFTGKYAAQQKSFSNLLMVLGFAIVVVALIMWLEFRSWTQVFIILLTVPLAGVGAVFSLWLCHQTVNVSSMIGAVLLVGIVVRNGILLLDYMNTQVAEGVPLKEAISSAALKRVRPILMTASVMVLGLVPLATGWGTGSELEQPMAVAVIGGILTSTILTLIVLPAAAALFIKEKK